MKSKQDPLSFVLTVILAIGLTWVALAAVVLIVNLLGLWGFWLCMSAAVVFPVWLVVRSRIQ